MVGHWTLDLTVMAAFLSASKLGTKLSGYRKDKSLSMHDILWCKGEKYYAILTVSGRSKVQTTESLPATAI